MPEEIEDIILIKLHGSSPEIRNRICSALHIMFSQDVFNIKNGNAILNFDSNGTLSSIDLNIRKWRKGTQEVPLVRLYKDVKIELSNTK